MPFLKEGGNNKVWIITARWLPNGCNQGKEVNLLYQKTITIQTLGWRKIPYIRVLREYIINADVTQQRDDRGTRTIFSSLQIRRTCTFEDVCTIGPFKDYIEFDCRNGLLVTLEDSRHIKYNPTFIYKSSRSLRSLTLYVHYN